MCDIWPFELESLIARFMGPTWDPPGANKTRWTPCWPHEICYLGSHTYKELQLGHHYHSDDPVPNAKPSMGIAHTMWFKKPSLTFPKFQSISITYYFAQIIQHYLKWLKRSHTITQNFEGLQKSAWLLRVLLWLTALLSVHNSPIKLPRPS